MKNILARSFFLLIALVGIGGSVFVYAHADDTANERLNVQDEFINFGFEEYLGEAIPVGNEIWVPNHATDEIYRFVRFDYFDETRFEDMVQLPKVRAGDGFKSIKCISVDENACSPTKTPHVLIGKQAVVYVSNEKSHTISKIEFKWGEPSDVGSTESGFGYRDLHNIYTDEVCLHGPEEDDLHAWEEDFFSRGCQDVVPYESAEEPSDYVYEDYEGMPRDGIGVEVAKDDIMQYPIDLEYVEALDRLLVLTSHIDKPRILVLTKDGEIDETMPEISLAYDDENYFQAKTFGAHKIMYQNGFIWVANKGVNGNVPAKSLIRINTFDEYHIDYINLPDYSSVNDFESFWSSRNYGYTIVVSSNGPKGNAVYEIDSVNGNIIYRYQIGSLLKIKDITKMDDYNLSLTLGCLGNNLLYNMDINVVNNFQSYKRQINTLLRSIH